MKEPRLLKAEEIEVRIGTINDKGATLLLYKDARVDQNILDDTFGIFGWQRDHKELKGNIYCGIGILNNREDERSDWVWKWDAGAESNTEAVKGEASDSFKRAAFNWGIGRELYTSPFIWISADKYKVVNNPKTGKPMTHDKFSVAKIVYNESNRSIEKIAITNDKAKQVVFVYEG